MIRRVAAILLLLVAAGIPAEATDGSFTRGLLWHIEAPGTAPSYLFGTMHSTDPAIAAPSAALRRILAGADSLTIEVVLDNTAQATMAEAMLLPKGSLLADFAGPTCGAAWPKPVRGTA